MNLTPPNLDISASVVAEYEQLEANPKWFLGFQGDLMVKEKILWEWVEQSVNRALMAMGQVHQNAFANDPIIAKDIYLILQQWFIRGLYMGIRKYTSDLGIGIGPLNPLSDRSRPRKKGEPPVEEWGELSELDPSDFDNPTIEEIE